jgi:hypothetical protein
MFAAVVTFTDAQPENPSHSRECYSLALNIPTGLCTASLVPRGQHY